MAQTTFMDQKLGWAACRFAESTRRKIKGRDETMDFHVVVGGVARRLSLSNFFMHVFFVAAVFFLHIKDAKFENVRWE